MIRAAFFGVTAALLVWAAVYVPMPLVSYAPGAARPVAPLVRVEHPTTAVNGSYDLLTVNVDQPTLIETIEGVTSSSIELQLRNDVIPSTIRTDEYFELQRLQFEQSFDVAAAVGLRQAGEQVTIVTAPVVAGVLPGGPADGTLEIGDRIVRFQGEAVETADQLVARARQVEVGDQLDLIVQRGTEELSLTVTAGHPEGMERPGLGILVETSVLDVQTPFAVALDNELGIGGPSAGMMIALTVYDLVSDQDLARGRTIAGTGTITIDGQVGPIGGIEEKVLTARQAGVDLFLAPSEQAEAAMAVAPKGMEVVAATTLDQVITELSR